VTTDALGAIERAEEAVRSLGFDVVRVRHYSDVARVEVDPSRVDDALAMSDEIIAAVRASGYADVTIDPRGYRRGGARLPVLDN
jgi:uncharacterized protein